MWSCKSDASSDDWCWRGCLRLLAEAICRTCLSHRSGVSATTDSRNRCGASTIACQPKACSFLSFFFFFCYPFAHAWGQMPARVCGPLLGNHWCKCWWHIKRTRDSTSWLIVWRRRKSRWPLSVKSWLRVQRENRMLLLHSCQIPGARKRNKRKNRSTPAICTRNWYGLDRGVEVRGLRP